MAQRSHAVKVISASLRDELEEDDIRVTNVLPGATATNFARHFPAPFVDKIIEISGTELTPKEGDHYSAETLDGPCQKYEQESLQPR